MPTVLSSFKHGRFERVAIGAKYSVDNQQWSLPRVQTKQNPPVNLSPVAMIKTSFILLVDKLPSR